MIVPELNTIFVHIPKCAGTFIERNLMQSDSFYFADSHGNLLKTELKDDGHVNIGEDKHRQLGYYKENFNKVFYDNFFKFTFVRNPFDRLFSLFNYMKMQENLDLLQDLSFDEWIESIYAHFMRNKCYAFYTGYEINMLNYISLDENIIDIDFVGKFENLQNDFKKVRKKINLKNLQINEIINGSEVNCNYKTAYKSLNTRNFVEEMCKQDLEYFNYSF